MTEKEAIQQLEFDREMILFDASTGETIEPEILKLLNEDNYKTYVADELAIKALKEIQKYREMEDKLRSKYGECDRLLETVVDGLLRHEGLDIGNPLKSKLLTDEDVDMWICPCCGERYEVDFDDYRHCPECGQAIDLEVEDYEETDE